MEDTWKRVLLRIPVESYIGREAGSLVTAVISLIGLTRYNFDLVSRFLLQHPLDLFLVCSKGHQALLDSLL